MAQVDRMEKWLRDLLSYAQPDVATAGRVRLNTLVERVCQQFSRDFEKQRIQSTVSLPAKLPLVVGDETAFEQVFTSIMANAMEAMPKGGTLTIGADRQSHDDTVLVTIRDTGVGMTDAQKSKLFTAFQTSKPKGMGLGLALVRRIVRRFGGDVRLESVAGAGTTVFLTFALPGAA